MSCGERDQEGVFHYLDTTTTVKSDHFNVLYLPKKEVNSTLASVSGTETL